MGLFNLSRRVLGKTLDNTASKYALQPERVDIGLPLNAQIGALLELQRAEFALLNSTLLTVPSSSQMPIVAVSRLRLEGDEDLQIYRLYTDTGTERSGIGASFLQILCGQGGVDTILDLAYYQFLCRQYTTTEAEQAPYRGEGFGLGESDYYMADDQLATIPQAANQIPALLGETDALHFIRDTPGGNYVRPFTARESRLDDPIGEKGVSKQLSFMPYLRPLPDGHQERLLISFDYVETMDGHAAPAAYVDFIAGVAFDRHKVKVL